MEYEGPSLETLDLVHYARLPLARDSVRLPLNSAMKIITITLHNYSENSRLIRESLSNILLSWQCLN